MTNRVYEVLPPAFGFHTLLKMEYDFISRRPYVFLGVFPSHSSSNSLYVCRQREEILRIKYCFSIALWLGARYLLLDSAHVRRLLLIHCKWRACVGTFPRTQTNGILLCRLPRAAHRVHSVHNKRHI